jgi:DNA polymerase III delta prime subunit
VLVEEDDEDDWSIEIDLDEVLANLGSRWEEVYRPKTLIEVYGYSKVKDEVTKFMDAWLRGVPKKKALLLVGGHGVGKTTMAHSIKETYNVKVREYDGREMEAKYLYESAITPGLDGRPILFVIDDADAMKSESKRRMRRLMLNTNNPLIFLASDKKKVPPDVKRGSTMLTMWKPDYRTIRKLLKHINEKEQVGASDDDLETIAKQSGNFRTAINSLYLYACEKGMVDVPDKEATIYEVTQSILENEALEQWFDPGLLSLFLSETVLDNFTGLVRADLDETIAQADLLLGGVHQTYFRPWGWARKVLNCVVPRFPLRTRIVIQHAGMGKTRIVIRENIEMMKRIRDKLDIRMTEKEWLRGGWHQVKKACELDIELVRYLKWEFELSGPECEWLHGKKADFKWQGPKKVEKKGALAFF